MRTIQMKFNRCFLILGTWLALTVLAAVPGHASVLQIFYKGPDLTVRSMWRNPDGSWSYELNLGGSGAYSNIATAVVP